MIAVPEPLPGQLTWCEGSGQAPDWLEIQEGEPFGPCPRCGEVVMLDRVGMLPQHSRPVERPAVSDDQAAEDLAAYMGVSRQAVTSVTDRGSLEPATLPSRDENHMLSTTDPLLTLNREIQTDDLLAGIRRQLQALSRRVGESDGVSLASLVELRELVEQCVTDAIAGQRNDPDSPASWSEIGEALGITRQAAQQRYGHVGGGRRPGGQPGNLR